MTTQAQETDFELPVINPWRTRPSREQVRFALDLARSELGDAARAATVERIPQMSAYELSNLIKSLKVMRGQRLRKAPRDRTWRLRL
jgi:hypothetical protein